MDVPALFVDKIACTTLVQGRTGLTPDDLDTLLEVSAGTRPDGVTKVYRPYYVTARLLATRKVQLTGGEGASMVDPLKVAAENLSQQQDVDQALELTVPRGMAARTNTLARPSASGVAPTKAEW